MTKQKTKTEKKVKKLTPSELGKRGGNAIAKRGAAYMSKIGKRGAKARWATK